MITSKPIHPAAVHFPIAFLALSFGLDIVHQLSPQLPKSVTSNLPPSTDLTRASYYLLSLGLIMAVPALVTGIREAIVGVNKQGLYEADGKTIRTKFKAMIAHAVINDVVLAGAAYIWYTRRSAAANTIAGKLGLGSAATGAAAYAPAGWMVAVEAALMAGMFMAANIGGVLAYNFGMGLNVGGGAAKKAQ